MILESVWMDGELLFPDKDFAEVGRMKPAFEASRSQANLAGSLLVSQFQVAAMARADVPQEKRRPFHLYVDEFQSFASDSFASILSEARKYGLSLILSHQYTEQVKPEIRHAVFGNVGSMVSFRVGQTDAEVLEREFGHAYPHAQFTRLGNFEVCSKLMVDGEHREPFLGRTMPHAGVRHGRRDAIIHRSRVKYSKRRAVVEGRIARWMENR